MKKLNTKESLEEGLQKEGSSKIDKHGVVIQGVRFPKEAFFGLAMGIFSEVVDALLLMDNLKVLLPNLGGANVIVSILVGAGCFFTMAFAGFCRANPKYYSEKGDRKAIRLWMAAGIVLLALRIISGMITGATTFFDVALGEATVGELFAEEEFIKNIAIGAAQFVLYLSSGYMSYDSVRMLTDNNLREYIQARREYRELSKKLADQNKKVKTDIEKLKMYPDLAERIVRSKSSAKYTVAQYNEAARALVEMKMAVSVKPNWMDEMYDNAMEKQKRLQREVA
ncbi:hypothetical protein IKG60_00830 [Candidatus Saccharibacteria bacterium]|nr:hypothetical protein [Candidatus Saccharibacteria bacterium]